MTVSDADATGVAYNIRSDGQGVYTDGSQNVQAVLDQSGTFAFNTNTSSRRAAVIIALQNLGVNSNLPTECIHMGNLLSSSTADNSMRRQLRKLNKTF